uniref:Antimicrobial peptide n=2 Tax=Ciona intestinalis TaxID=7719 RepID=F6VW54_CIOIN
RKIVFILLLVVLLVSQATADDGWVRTGLAVARLVVGRRRRRWNEANGLEKLSSDAEETLSAAEMEEVMQKIMDHQE